MTDYKLLKMAMIRSDVKVQELCAKCGFSAGYFYKCTSGKQDFRTSEVAKMCEVIGIDADEMTRIFFTANVGNMSHAEA